MKTPPLVRAAHLHSLIDPLAAIGTPIERRMEQSRLPLSALEDPGAMVSELAVWNFMELVARRDADLHYGYRCAMMEPISDVGQIGGFKLKQRPTLHLFLKWFIRSVNAYATHAKHELRSDDGEDWYVFDQALIGRHVTWQLEQYLVGYMTQFIRLAVGLNWVPSRLRLVQRNQTIALPEDWSATRIEFGQSVTAVAISRRLLASPLKHFPSARRASRGRLAPTSRHSGFPDLLKTTIKPYFIDRRYKIQNVADALQLSVRSLQRLLASHDTSYRELLNEIRFELATEHLNDPDAKILDIAIQIDYSGAADFIKAFKKIAGVSPGHFRQIIQQGRQLPSRKHDA